MPNEIKSAIADMLLEGPDEDSLWSETGTEAVHQDEYRTRSQKHKDLLHYRLLCRGLNDSTWHIIGAHFCEVTIALERNSLKALIKLSENSTYQQYIESIVIQFSYYSEDLMKAYCQCYKNRHHGDPG